MLRGHLVHRLLHAALPVRRYAQSRPRMCLQAGTGVCLWQADSIVDMVRQQLQQVASGRADELSEAEVKNLTKRKLAAVRTWTAFPPGPRTPVCSGAREEAHRPHHRDAPRVRARAGCLAAARATDCTAVAGAPNTAVC